MWRVYGDCGICEYRVRILTQDIVNSLWLRIFICWVTSFFWAIFTSPLSQPDKVCCITLKLLYFLSSFPPHHISLRDTTKFQIFKKLNQLLMILQALIMRVEVFALDTPNLLPVFWGLAQNPQRFSTLYP